jgi:hypothetical protein
LHDVLEALLPHLHGRRDAHLLVETLAQTAAQQGRIVELPGSLVALAMGRGTSALARVCRRIPRGR